MAQAAVLIRQVEGHDPVATAIVTAVDAYHHRNRNNIPLGDFDYKVWMESHLEALKDAFIADFPEVKTANWFVNWLDINVN